MSVSSFHLLLLLLTPWLGNAMPTSESTESASRQSRQMFPYNYDVPGVVPWPQPTSFYDFGSLVRNLDPSVKQKLLAGLITMSAAVSENPSLLVSGYKGDIQTSQSSNPILSELYSHAYDDPSITAGQNLPYTMEELIEMESRFGIDTVIRLVLQALVGQAVNTFIIPAILAFIASIFAG